MSLSHIELAHVVPFPEARNEMKMFASLHVGRWKSHASASEILEYHLDA